MRTIYAMVMGTTFGTLFGIGMKSGDNVLMYGSFACIVGYYILSMRFSKYNK